MSTADSSRASSGTLAGERLLVVAGATGTGKSALSLDLADAVADRGGTAEIVNADAMQLYRGMDIGTAKLSVGERRGHPHHLLDVLDVTEESTVAAYQELARSTIRGILDRGSVPILVGGSGLYVSSVIYDFRFPAREPGVRARLEAELAASGAASLYERLHDLAPDTAERIGPHNARRIVRALEVIEIEGDPAAASLPEEPVPWMPMHLIGVRVERAALVERLDRRVSDMWSSGLLAEVRILLDAGLREGPTSSRAIGYAQATAQLDGVLTETEAIDQARFLTRRYARRQVSWFTRYPRIHWVDGLDETARASAVAQALA